MWKRLRRKMEENPALAQSLREVGFRSAIGLLSTYAGEGPDLATWLSHAQINRDGNLRLQYSGRDGVEPLRGKQHL